MRTFTALALIAVFFSGVSKAVAAENNVHVCNHFSQPLYLALGYQARDGWNTIGWWSINPNRCRPFNVPYKSFLFYAETDWYDVPQGRQRDNWGHGHKLYIAQSGGFHYSQADRPHAGSRLVDFEKSFVWNGDGDIREDITYGENGQDIIQTLHTSASTGDHGTPR